MRWLHLRLRAPLGSFGGEAIDAYGVTRDFPARSMLAGLLANALGWKRSMREQHQALQDRLVFGAVQQRTPIRLTDHQTARLHQDDCSWSTRGTPIGRLPSPSYRAGGPRGRQLTHRQWRDYLADLDTSVVLRLDPADLAPTLDELAAALERPARVLFLGRKPCLPTAPLFGGWVTAPDARSTLCAVLPVEAAERPAVWPASEGAEGSSRTTHVTDERNWISGLHGSSRPVCEGWLSAAAPGTSA